MCGMVVMLVCMGNYKKNSFMSATSTICRSELAMLKCLTSVCWIIFACLMQSLLLGIVGASLSKPHTSVLTGNWLFWCTVYMSIFLIFKFNNVWEFILLYTWLCHFVHIAMLPLQNDRGRIADWMWQLNRKSSTEERCWVKWARVCQHEETEVRNWDWRQKRS